MNWTKNEIDLLYEMYENDPRENIMALIKRGWKAIYFKANKLGLKRNPKIKDI